MNRIKRESIYSIIFFVFGIINIFIGQLSKNFFALVFGWILLIVVIIYSVYLYKQKKKQKEENRIRKENDDHSKTKRIKKRRF